MKNNTLLRWSNLIAFFVTFGLNTLANALPLNGQDTDENSDRFEVLFVPAGYGLSIWFLIYLSLFAFAIYPRLDMGRAQVPS